MLHHFKFDGQDFNWRRSIMHFLHNAYYSCGLTMALKHVVLMLGLMFLLATLFYYIHVHLCFQF